MVIGTSANRSPVIRRSALGLLGASTKSAQRFAAVLDGWLHDARLYGTKRRLLDVRLHVRCRPLAIRPSRPDPIRSIDAGSGVGLTARGSV